jgi:KipI family sensor histidine kinase inhibitor
VSSRPGGTTPVLRRCGDTGWLLDLDDNPAVHRWAAAVRDAGLTGVVDVVPGLTTLLVTLDPDSTTPDALAATLAELRPGSGSAPEGERHLLDVRYDGEDLDEVAELTGLTAAEVVAAHTGTPWRVAFCGFVPGFAYLVGGDSRLQVPRRGESRLRVPAGAVAVAGEFSSVYPRPSPGGWQLLGHTDEVLWDQAADPPAVLRPGAVVEFRDVTSR